MGQADRAGKIRWRVQLKYLDLVEAGTSSVFLSLARSVQSANYPFVRSAAISGTSHSVSDADVFGDKVEMRNDNNEDAA